MSARAMSPGAAQTHMRRIARNRYKALRLGHRVDSPAIVADRLVTYLAATALALPIWLNVDRRRNQAEKKRTEKILKATRFDRSGAHEMDAL